MRRLWDISRNLKVNFPNSCRSGFIGPWFGPCPLAATHVAALLLLFTNVGTTDTFYGRRVEVGMVWYKKATEANRNQRINTNGEIQHTSLNERSEAHNEQQHYLLRRRQRQQQRQQQQQQQATMTRRSTRGEKQSTGEGTGKGAPPPPTIAVATTDTTENVFLQQLKKAKDEGWMDTWIKDKLKTSVGKTQLREALHLYLCSQDSIKTFMESCTDELLAAIIKLNGYNASATRSTLETTMTDLYEVRLLCCCG